MLPKFKPVDFLVDERLFKPVGHLLLAYRILVDIPSRKQLALNGISRCEAVFFRVFNANESLQKLLDDISLYAIGNQRTPLVYDIEKSHIKIIVHIMMAARALARIPEYHDFAEDLVDFYSDLFSTAIRRDTSLSYIVDETRQEIQTAKERYGDLLRATPNAEFDTVKYILLAGIGLVESGDIEVAHAMRQLAESRYAHITHKYGILLRSTQALRNRIDLKEKYGQKDSEETRPVSDA